MNTAHGKDNSQVIITGTSRGIGYHLALRFLAEGYGVIGISRSETEINDPGFSSFKADVGDVDAIHELCARLKDLTVIGLINNAGVHGPIGPFEEASMEEWVKTFYVNLFGGAALSQACIPALRKNSGFIINFSGGGSAFPRVNFSAYGTCKTAVVRLSEVMAKELAPEICVYCVAPGPNRTQLLDEVIRSGEIVPEEDKVGFEQVENLCLFLARNQDPRYSGKFIHVMDDYPNWGDSQLNGDRHTLRRLDPRTLRKLQTPD